MLLSHKVIKQVGSEMEDWPIHPRFCFTAEEETEKYYPVKDYTQEADVILKNAHSEAEELLKSAHSEAEKLLTDTKNTILSIEQEAYNKGFEQGEQDARLVNQKARDDFYTSTREVLQQIKEIREKMYRDTEKELVELAVDIAEKLVFRQLELDPGTVIDIAKAACTQAKECELVIIYIKPDQFESIKARKDEVISQLYKTKRFEFVADPTIESGGCRIETEQGYIDATIETMLKHLNTIIKGKA
jgi:flagellar assembly protein FliH